MKHTEDNTTRRRRTAALLALATASIVLAGCGDDGGGEAGAAGGGDPEAYCDQVEQLESQDQAPTDEQLNELVSVAPAEIRTDVEQFAEAIRTNDMEAAGVAEAESRILDWEEQNCT